MDINAFGPGARFHHIGMVVPSLDPRSCGEVFADPIQKVSVSFITLNGLDVELVAPDGPGSPVHNSMTKGVKLLHLCYEVDDLEAAIACAAGHGFSPLARPVPAVAFAGRRIAWLFSRVYGLVELLEAQTP